MILISGGSEVRMKKLAKVIEFVGAAIFFSLYVCGCNGKSYCSDTDYNQLTFIVCRIKN